TASPQIYNAPALLWYLNNTIMRWQANSSDASSESVTAMLYVARAFQIRRISSFCKPRINRPDEISRLVEPALRLPKPSQTRGRTHLQRSGALTARYFNCLIKTQFRLAEFSRAV